MVLNMLQFLTSAIPATECIRFSQYENMRYLAGRVGGFFAAASPTLYYHFEPKFYANFRQSEVFLNCNIHHTS